jgi:hypothetical protein
MAQPAIVSPAPGPAPPTPEPYHVINLLAGVLDPRLALARPNAGIFRDASGAYVVAGANVPRFDHIGGEPQGLLVEPTRTNFIKQSRMGGAQEGRLGGSGALPTGWTSGSSPGLSVDVDETPMHGMPALFMHVYGTTIGAGQFIPVWMGPASDYATAPGEKWALSVDVLLATGPGCTINLTVGEHSATNFLTAGNNQHAITAGPKRRITYIHTVQNAQATRVQPYVNFVAMSGAVDFTVGLQLPQMEKGARPTSPIPTDGAAATRGPETVQLGNLAGLSFSPLEGTLLAEGQLVYSMGDDTLRFVGFDDGTADEFMGFEFVAQERAMYGRIRDGGSHVVNSAMLVPVEALSPFRIGMAYKANDVALSAKGSAPIVDTSASLPTVNRLAVGWDGHLREIAYRPKRLTNAELQESTRVFGAPPAPPPTPPPVPPPGPPINPPPTPVPPSAGGYPWAEPVARTSGPITVSGDGKVIEGYTRIDGGIRTTGVCNGLIIRRNRIHMQHGGQHGIEFTGACPGAIVEGVHVFNEPFNGRRLPREQRALKVASGSHNMRVSRFMLQNCGGMYFYRSNGVVVEFAVGLNLRCHALNTGGDPRGYSGQFCQFNESANPILRDFWTFTDLAIGSTVDNVSLHGANGGLVERGVIDGNTDPVGVGVMVEHQTTQQVLVRDVDTLRMGNGGFSGYDGSVVLFERCRNRDFYSEPAKEPRIPVTNGVASWSNDFNFGSNGIHFVGAPGTQTRFRSCKYWGTPGGGIAWQVGSTGIIEAGYSSENFQVRPHIELDGFPFDPPPLVSGRILPRREPPPLRSKAGAVRR